MLLWLVTVFAGMIDDSLSDGFMDDPETFRTASLVRAYESGGQDGLINALAATRRC